MLNLTRVAVLFIFCAYCKADQECKDAYPNCKENNVNCSQPYADSFCAYTCGYCDTTTPKTMSTAVKTTTDACVDQFPGLCLMYVTNNCTDPLMKLICARSCGYCGTSPAITSPVSTPTSVAPTCPEPSPIPPCECPEVCEKLGLLCAQVQSLMEAVAVPDDLQSTIQHFCE